MEDQGKTLAIARLRAAIDMHKKHMDGSAPTTGAAGEKSQMAMMRLMREALASLNGRDPREMAAALMGRMK